MNMDKMFVNPKHQESVDQASQRHILLSDSILVYCKKEKLWSMVQKVISEQSNGISQITNWMKKYK